MNSQTNENPEGEGMRQLRETAQGRFDNFAPMQSRRESWREAWQNTAAALLISVCAHRYIVMPLLDEWAALGNERADWTAAFCTTLFYTTLSLARNYIIRRVHAQKDHRRRLRQMQNPPQK